LQVVAHHTASVAP